jgi:hypothetical protein
VVQKPHKIGEMLHSGADAESKELKKLQTWIKKNMLIAQQRDLKC